MIEFSKDEKAILVNKLKDYLSDELSVELGTFDAEFLLDFVAKEFGAYFYNRGLYDAQTLLQARMDDVSEAIYELEQITEFQR